MSCPTFVCAASYSIAALLVAKLTPAEATPVAPASASCTVAAQLAQVIPSVGSTIRALLMARAVELVGRGRGAALARWLHDEQPTQHVHTAAEGILARLLRREFNRGGLERRQLLIDAEPLEHDPLRAIGCLVAVELQPHRLSRLHDDRVGRVAAFDDHADLLHAAGDRRRRYRAATREEEVPQHPDDGDGAERRDGDLGGGHAPPPPASGPESSRETTRCAWRRRSATRTPARSRGTRRRAPGSTWRRARRSAKPPAPPPADRTRW